MDKVVRSCPYIGIRNLASFFFYNRLLSYILSMFYQCLTFIVQWRQLNLPKPESIHNYLESITSIDGNDGLILFPIRDLSLVFRIEATEHPTRERVA